MTELYERISYAIDSSGKRRGSVAEEIGVSPAHITRLCTNKVSPSDRTLKSIADACGVDYHWLRSGEGEMKPEKSADEKLNALISEALADKPENFKRLILEALADLDDDGWRYAWYLIQQLRGNHDT